MKNIVFLLLVFLCGCRSTPSDPFAAPVVSSRFPAVERSVLTLNPNGPPLRADENPKDYEKETENEWRSIAEQELLKFFEKEGVSFIDTPGSFIFMPKRNGLFMRDASHKYYLVVIQSPSNMKKIKEILKRYE